MIKSVGLDIVQILRITQNVEKYGDRFVSRILGDEELVIYNKRRDGAVFLAGRFAAKEAIIKSFGALLKVRPPYSSLQVLPDDAGVPQLIPSEAIENSLDDRKLLISITHEKQYAAAVAILTEAE